MIESKQIKILSMFWLRWSPRNKLVEGEGYSVLHDVHFLTN